MLVGVAVVAALTLGGNDDNSSLAADANAEPVIESEPSSTTTTTTESAPEPESSSTTTTTTEVPGLSLISGEFADQEIDVFVFNHDVAEDLRAHTPEFFTANGGATVNFVTFEQQTTREVVAVNAIIGGAFADVVMLGSFETSQFAENGWLCPLDRLTCVSPIRRIGREALDFEVGDLVPSVRDLFTVDGDLFAAPLYAESTFLMFNSEIMAAAGIEIPQNPTWDQIAAIAAQVHSDDVAGICLRGRPDWGDLGASLTTVVNTFGGTWWEANEDGTPGEPQINQPDSGFRNATEFYVQLVQDSGPPDAANTSYDECLELFGNGQVAMWYDSTRTPDLLNQDGASVRPDAGNFGVVAAPVGPTGIASGWLWTWSLAATNGGNTPPASMEFVRWATSQDFAQLVGDDRGWQGASAARLSTINNPEYQAATEPWGQVAAEAITNANPLNPGTTPRPGTAGVQYVGIPEFPDVGTACTTEISAAIAATITIDEALDRCQAIASAQLR